MPDGAQCIIHHLPLAALRGEGLTALLRDTVVLASATRFRRTPLRFDVSKLIVKGRPRAGLEGNHLRLNVFSAGRETRQGLRQGYESQGENSSRKAVFVIAKTGHVHCESATRHVNACGTDVSTIDSTVNGV